MKTTYEYKLARIGVIVAFFAFLLLTLLPPSATAAGRWQEKQLYQPAGWQLEREQRGLVTIYQGFTDRQVEAVMDEQFGRVQYMMFTDTVVTDEQGEPVRDENSGEVVTENDDCG